ncbi:MAG TPA: terpene synthase family protein [Nannocystis sp.]
MSRIAARVDQDLLARLMAWAAEFEDFAVHHAADGLYIAQECRTEDLPEDREAVFLIAIVIAFWFWFDDRSDKFLREQTSPVDWEALSAFAQDPLHGRGGDTPEERYFRRMSAALAARAGTPEEHRWWAIQSVRVIEAMHAEEVVSRRGEAPSFVECLENGGDSTTLMSIMSSGYLAYGMNRPARHGDVRLANVERYMLLSQRLLNDLYSFEKERKEGHAGRPSNLVLMMEKLMPTPQARAFCEEQRRGYERLMQHNIELLGPDDPFGKMTAATMRCISRWYEIGPLRYTEDC